MAEHKTALRGIISPLSVGKSPTLMSRSETVIKNVMEVIKHV